MGRDMVKAGRNARSSGEGWINRQTVGALVAAISYSIVLISLAALAGCSEMEGDGFSNNGHEYGPVRCVRAKDNVLRCYTIK